MSIVTYGDVTPHIAGRPSPIIWKDCPVIQFIQDPAKGFHVFDDFKLAPGADGVAGFRWFPYLDTGSTLVIADDEKGILELTTDSGNNDSTTIISGNNTTGCITPANNSARRWWFEARITVSDVADLGIFIGLTQEGQAADTKPMADTAPTLNTDIDCVGFHESDGAALDLVYNLANIGVQSTNVIATMVAGTYYNLGLKYDPIDNKVRVYVDGVENQDAAFLMSHASAPADCLAVCISLKAITGAANGDKLSVDWVRYASEY